MGLFDFFFGSKKKKSVVKEIDKRDFFPRTSIPTRTYNKSIQDNKADDDWWEREKKRRKKEEEDRYSNNDLLSPLNPLSPLWYGNQQDDTIQPSPPSVEYGGGSFGGAGSSSDWSPPDTSSSDSSSHSSSDSSSSYDSGSSDSGSSDSGGCDSGGSSD